MKDPVTERLLAKGVEGPLRTPAEGVETVRFSDVSAAGYVVGIDFPLLKFHSDV